MRNRDFTIIRTSDVPCRGRFSRFQDIYKRLLGISLLINLSVEHAQTNFHHLSALHKGGEYASAHWCKMRNEGQSNFGITCYVKLLTDFGMMTMTRHSVCFERLCGFTKYIRIRRFSPAPLTPDFASAIRDIVSTTFISEEVKTLVESQWDTARNCYQLCLLDIIPVYLRQTINCHVNQLWTSMRRLITRFPKSLCPFILKSADKSITFVPYQSILVLSAWRQHGG